MWQLDDAAGLNDGHFGHCLHADRPSGRQCSWKILNLIVTALWPRGLDLKIVDKPGAILTAEGTHRKILHAAAPYNRVAQRRLMSDLGKKSAKARREKLAAMTEEERKRAVKHIAKKARATRRKNKLIRAKAAKAAAQIKRARSGQRPCVATASPTPIPSPTLFARKANDADACTSQSMASGDL
jgi:hypothetical protein